MADTTILGLPLIASSQAQKHVTHNEALLDLDALVQIAVADRNLSAPPGAPVDGDRYIVAAGGTGAWAGQDNKIAVRRDGLWVFHTPNEGWLAWIADEDTLTVWSGAAWIAAASGGGGGVTDGDKGDISVTGSGSAWTIDAGAVTNAKLANVATASLKGRTSAGTGAPEDLTAAQVKTLLAITQGDVAGLVAALAGKATPGDISAAISALVASSPAVLDTLNELALALGNDPNFATTMTTALAGKQTTLVSGTNLKSVNGASLLGAGNLAIAGLPAGGALGQALVKTASGDFATGWESVGLWPELYGAVAGGATDDAAFWNAAEAASTAGVPLNGRGRTYTLDTRKVRVGAGKLTFKDLKIVWTTSGPGTELLLSGSLFDARTLLTADVAGGVNGATVIPVASTAGFAVGRKVLMISDGFARRQKSGELAANVTKRSEYAYVTAINPGVSLTLDRRLKSTYLTADNARILNCPFDLEIDFDNVVMETPYDAARTHFAFYCAKIKRLKAGSLGSGSQAFQFRYCDLTELSPDSHLHGVKTYLPGDPNSGGYIGNFAGCDGGFLPLMTGDIMRHGPTGGDSGTASCSATAGDNLVQTRGMRFGLKILTGCYASPDDFHEGAVDVDLGDCFASMHKDALTGEDGGTSQAARTKWGRTIIRGAIPRHGHLVQSYGHADDDLDNFIDLGEFSMEGQDGANYGLAVVNESFDGQRLIVRADKMNTRFGGGILAENNKTGPVDIYVGHCDVFLNSASNGLAGLRTTGTGPVTARVKYLRLRKGAGAGWVYGVYCENLAQHRVEIGEFDSNLPAGSIHLRGTGWISITDRDSRSGGALVNYDGNDKLDLRGLGVLDGDRGDITVSNSATVAGSVWTIDAGVVSNAKLANMAANSLKGNNTGAAAVALDLTPSQVKTLLAITGADVANTPAGGLTATTVQAAINELDSEKFNAAGGTVSGSLTVSGDLVVNGTTFTANATTVTYDDIILVVGGDTAPVADDAKDRGVEFRWHNGAAAKLGFFGFDRSAQEFLFVPDAVDAADVISGAIGTVRANVRADFIGVNTTGDATNKLAVNSSAILFNNIGAGVQVKVNKAAVGDTASFLFQTGFSGRAEIGTTGDDDFHFKVSADGATYFESLWITGASGLVTVKNGFVLDPAAGDPATPVNGQVWYNSTSGKFRKRENGVTSNLDTTGSGGSVTTELTAVFAAPSPSQFFDFALAGAAPGQKVVVTPSLDMPAGLSEDELEMEPLAVSGRVLSAGNIRLHVASLSGAPVLGSRNFNVIVQ
jgi:Protein of unknown function (DUF2793)